MRELSLALPRNKKPYYLRIAEALRNAINEGQLQRGESLPSTRELARMLRVHRHTVMAAFEELVAEGWLIAKHRQNFQVSNELPSWFFAAKAPGLIIKNSSTKHNWRVTRQVDHFIQPPGSITSAKYNFQSGLPDLRLFPHHEWRSFLLEAFKQSPTQVMGYGNPAGYLPFVKAIQTYLRRVRGIANREIIVTHGSQEGIFLVAQLLIKPNDVVAVERLGYSPAWTALRAAGAKLMPIEIDNEGLDPDSLEKLLKKHKVRLIYVTPLHQYPTTVTLSISRRLRIYELAAQYGVPILEDDYDHEFHYRSQPLMPLASRDPDEQIIYVSTFSKILYPSARLGFLAVPPSLAEKLSNYKRIISRQNDLLLQQVALRWMNDGGFERHLRRMRRIYEERRETILACITDKKQAGVTLSCQIPDGGMAIWLNIHSDADHIMQVAAQHKVRVSSESLYSLTKTRPTHLRLGFANQNPEEIRAGMNILLNILANNS